MELILSFNNIDPSPFFTACKKNNIYLVKLLINSGEYNIYRKNGTIALDIAHKMKHKECYDIILSSEKWR
jgi:ankyrin repeat protein